MLKELKFTNKSVMPKIFSSSILDFNLVVMPVWISLIYFTLIHYFPEYRLQIFMIFLFLLGESHFASTWLFFTDSKNRNYFIKNSGKFILFPIVLIGIYVYIGLLNINNALLLGSIISAFHVVRQSIGVFKIYGGNKYKIFSLAIYFFSGVWLLVGFMRFYLPNLDFINIYFTEYQTLVKFFSISGLILCALTIIYAKLIIKDKSTFYSLLSGILLYIPYLFVSDIKDAIVAGVGMHWCQYIALTGKAYILSSPKLISLSNFLKISFIAIYSFIFTYIDTSGGTSLQSVDLLVLIPLSLQLYHYYIDAFIWRFSNPFIRENIGTLLFARKAT